MSTYSRMADTDEQENAIIAVEKVVKFCGGTNIINIDEIVQALSV